MPTIEIGVRTYTLLRRLQAAVHLTQRLRAGNVFMMKGSKRGAPKRVGYTRFSLDELYNSGNLEKLDRLTIKASLTETFEGIEKGDHILFKKRSDEDIIHILNKLLKATEGEDL